MTENFITERDRRKNIIIKKGLSPMLCELVKINGKPISTRTVENTFQTEQFSNLKGVRLRVWLESEAIVNRFEKEANTYSESEQ